MADGAPNGYSILNFDGHEYTLDFFAASRSKDYQMQIHAEEEVPANRVDEAVVHANVFNGSEKTRVEMRLGENGEWTPMQLAREADPTYKKAFEAEKALGKVPWKNMPKPANSMHLWKANLSGDYPTGTYWLHVRATQEDGKVLESQRIIRIGEPQDVPAVP